MTDAKKITKMAHSSKGESFFLFQAIHHQFVLLLREGIMSK
ncbi:hypothetical protein HMPREF9087_2504 [Enterococcus casseliflavus ATCC 12755]|uniref:Uncharacterized protein n=1 Tax=Enterococcus casseliflavus ATCC 12755 TaxID=888066 RepID=F0EM62_ENTCA|nr:hypothetical protein HMPREF9087_2504 [Enterococcus casseliflavus ATCC 12755]EPH66089.1 hypothetical protein D931_01328 [Enterococcus faecium 13.SD.W.09]